MLFLRKSGGGFAALFASFSLKYFSSCKEFIRGSNAGVGRLLTPGFTPRYRRGICIGLFFLLMNAVPIETTYSQGVRVYAHSIVDSRNYVYSSLSNSWSTRLTPSYLTSTQWATDAFGNVFSYHEGTRRVNRYLANTNSWADVSHLPTLGRYNGLGYNLEVTNSGEFILSEYGQNRVFFTDGSTSWQSKFVGRTNLTADYDPVSDTYAVGLYYRKQFARRNSDNSFSFSSSQGTGNEVQRLGSIVDGYLVQNTSNQGINRWDMSNIAAAPATLQQPQGTYWVSGDVDRNTNTLYLNNSPGGRFLTYDVNTGQQTILANSPSLRDSSLTVVNTDVLISGQTFNTSQTAVSRYDHSVYSLTIGDSSGSGNARISGGSTLNVGGGSTQIGSNGALAIDSGSRLETFGSSINSGLLTNNGTLTNYSTLTNNGTLTNTGTLDNQGTFNQNGGRLTTDQLFTGGTFNFNGGTLEITDAGQALTVGSTEFSLTNGAAFNTSAGTTTLGSNQHLEIAGAATVDSGATLTMSGGSLTSGTFTNNGTIHTTSGTSTIAGDVQNDGGFQVDTGSGLVFLNELSGSGPFTGGGEVTFEGGLNPGNSPGTIEFGGDVTLGANSLTTIEIAGLSSADFDRLVLNNLDSILSIETGAALDVQLINGFTLDFNQEFIFTDIAGTNAPVGTFDGLGEGDLVGNFGGTDLFISYSAGTGNDISFFTAVPEPGALVMFSIAVGVLGVPRRRRRAK